MALLLKKEKTEIDKLREALMTGVSYMIPVIVAGGMMLAFGSLFETLTGVDLKESNSLAAQLINDLKTFGLYGLTLLFPVIAAFVGFGLAGKPAIAPGLIAGMLARDMQMGFLGALLGGLMVGYLVRWMLANIKLPKEFRSLLPMVIIPLIGSAIILFVMKYIVGYPLIALNTGLENWLVGMSGGNKVVMAAVLGAMVGFDLGGPINKAAITVSLGLFAQGIFEPVTASHIAIMIAPFGIGLSTIFAKQYYSKELQENGRAALMMSCVGISEGAIPFILANPALIIINTVGSAISAAMVIMFDSIVQAPAAGILALILSSNFFLYFISIATGVAFVAVATTVLMKRQFTKQATEAETQQQAAKSA
ncbi:PTS sorbitol transporter subunit IIA [Photobacterium gaetbulicola]|uniref:PTS sorbitol transporter subunit IIA n=2 Tax=Photobacterium gaetbulicola TaxID=1295392 RepID=A0A0B9H853_9GAMM|nr:MULTISPECIES: PTS fructose transporter subunit IIC [Photobacterium]AJR05615.1 putative PTS system, IIC component [Photobacterium gaetbulicola Gung47]KHT65087.1 PTS sorbitol transporter subunit IIA [Photobacterium gaetbulicola]PSU14596.1 PTS sorbitol transporter subunit IIA [Photobacterium gaetbulicola]WEM44235.1 PTS fructose transporter subunit IIC [Photobacterium sp. DA100]